MTIKEVGVLAAAAVAIAALVGPSFAQDNSALRETYNQAGTHQFHVWCTQGVQSFETKKDGANAEDAQMKVYNEAVAAGKTSCWAIWRGKVG
jgi:hypothetical protein